MPVQDTIYVYSITYDTRQRGPHTEIQFTVDVRIDSDHDGDRKTMIRPSELSVVLSVYDTAVTELNSDSNIRNFVGTMDEGHRYAHTGTASGPAETTTSRCMT